MSSIPKFIQGTFPYTGAGLDTPKPLGPRAVYLVPDGKRAQLVYVRAGNSSNELVTLLFTKNSRPLRYFPIGAKQAYHVTLAVNEMLLADSEISLMLAAPEGTTGEIVVDFGLMEID
jgi:hypothetical protein